MIMPWYIPSPPDGWTLIGNNPPSCSHGCNICAIQAMDNNGQPVFTVALLREMIRAQHNCLESTNVLLHA